MELLCPICAAPLRQTDKTFRCDAGHSFDMARQGYINLLPVQNKRSLNPGDTREQVLSRRSFLEAGFYAPIAQALCDAARDNLFYYDLGKSLQDVKKDYTPTATDIPADTTVPEDTTAPQAE